jgi:hypothetical protein
MRGQSDGDNRKTLGRSVGGLFHMGSARAEDGRKCKKQAACLRAVAVGDHTRKKVVMPPSKKRTRYSYQRLSFRADNLACTIMPYPIRSCLDPVATAIQTRRAVPVAAVADKRNRFKSWQTTKQ